MQQPTTTLSIKLDGAYEWRVLALLNYFRASIALAFCLLYVANKLLPPLGSHNPDSFFKFSLLYGIGSVVLYVLINRQSLSFNQFVYSGAIIDSLCITALMHYSGGIESGLGVLLVVPIGANTIILRRRTALGLAAFATIILLSEQFSSLGTSKQSSYPIAGLLGFTYFACVLMVHWLATRIRESEALAQKRGIDLANLAQLTQHIIQRMQTGVLVIDQFGTIRLSNEAARSLLGLKDDATEIPLEQIAPGLAHQWYHWKNTMDINISSVHIPTVHIDVLPRFARIGDTAEAGTLIFVQDSASLTQQAQQLQLASLGRLTASIAHEIRNPLGAISHAGQLLAESTTLDKNDQRLTKIILDHSQRLNTIVENVMSVSRRRPSQIEFFLLRDFLQRFLSDYCAGQNYDPARFKITVCPDDLRIRFDTGHLRQILINLCDNALRHSKPQASNPWVTLRAGYDASGNRPHLDVIDSGIGVKPEALQNLFEPFFTTESKGTGLGLYLSRELAEANQAHLNYISKSGEPGIFRITFQDPRRQFE